MMSSLRLLRIVLTLSILSLLACEKQITKSEAPVISFNRDIPIKYLNNLSTPAVEADILDDLDNPISYYYRIERFSFVDSSSSAIFEQVRAHADEISTNSQLALRLPNNARTGLYYLTLRAGDKQVNRSEEKQLVYYHPSSGLRDFTDLIPFGRSDTMAYWEFSSTDTLHFKKFTVYSESPIAGFSLFKVGYGENQDPSFLGAARLLEPVDSLRLDQLGGIPFSASVDSALMIISLDLANQNSIIYTYPTVFR